MSTQPPIPTPIPTPSQSSGVLRGFLVSCAISAGIALVGLAGIAVGFGLIIVVPYALIQLAWTLPLFFSYRGKGQHGEAKGVLLSIALNVVLSVACWGAILTNLSFH
ncbi:hypothetical protein Acid345_2132 [Candidatus Koribacter versatilis Ellin345]|uniref:Uncharacterized protein n=1 Tax=Koribacter versatilis (strain Ellin345) TaxID=204669 RepID=Q1IPR7_KORVE|nr:hypothetical protein [Candidatus Koribacter versatilis]ABF41133.1 hypothetical protein Acid345_2132 [Candidatus Koribacter versatilis Ellin345]